MNHLRSVSTDPLGGLRMEDPPGSTTSTAEELAGDAEDDDEEDDESDGDEDNDEEEEPLGEPGKKALERERSARKEAERELRKLKREGEGEAERAQRDAVEEVEQRYQGVIARAAFRAELAEAGLKKGQEKMLRLLDLEDVTVEEDGTVEGVADQVKALRAEFPELFTKSREIRGRGDGGNKGQAPDRKLSSAERLAAQAGIGPDA